MLGRLKISDSGEGPAKFRWRLEALRPSLLSPCCLPSSLSTSCLSDVSSNYLTGSLPRVFSSYNMINMSIALFNVYNNYFSGDSTNFYYTSNYWSATCPDDTTSPLLGGYYTGYYLSQQVMLRQLRCDVAVVVC